MQSLVEKKKFLNLEPRMSYLGVLGSNFIFEISLLEFVLLQILVQK